MTHATLGQVFFLLILLGPVIYFINSARKGRSLHIRRIAGLDAIDEAIGRSVEMGRPVAFSTGLTSVSPVLYAVLGVLSYVSKKSASYKQKLLVAQYQPEVMAIVEDVVYESYNSVGRLANFEPQDIRFLSDEQFAYASGYMGMVHRENVGSAFLFGYFAAESLILAEAGKQVGATQVAASISPEQVAFFICACDYTLIGEELFAAAAYLSRDPVQLGSLVGQDWCKLFITIFMVFGVLFSTLKVLFTQYGLEFQSYLVYFEYIYKFILGPDFVF